MYQDLELYLCTSGSRCLIVCARLYTLDTITLLADGVGNLSQSDSGARRSAPISAQTVAEATPAAAAAAAAARCRSQIGGRLMICSVCARVQADSVGGGQRGRLSWRGGRRRAQRLRARR